MFVVACGDPEPSLNEEVDQCEGMVPAEHDHPDMVPAVHDHPDAEPVGALDATGHYLLEFKLTSNSCDEEFDADAQEFESGGLWTMAAVQDTYIFFTGDFMLTSADGSLFTFDVEVLPEESWFCSGGESYHFETTLDFTTQDLSGEYLKHYSAVDCWVGVDDDGNSLYESPDCTYTWVLQGTKQ
jgi:hypothetical protein